MERVAGACQRVQQITNSYDEGREPNKLDCLVIHVDRLYSMLVALDLGTEILEAVVLVLVCSRKSINHKV